MTFTVWLILNEYWLDISRHFGLSSDVLLSLFHYILVANAWTPSYSCSDSLTPLCFNYACDWIGCLCDPNSWWRSSGFALNRAYSGGDRPRLLHHSITQLDEAIRAWDGTPTSRKRAWCASLGHWRSLSHIYCHAAAAVVSMNVLQTYSGHHLMCQRLPWTSLDRLWEGHRRDSAELTACYRWENDRRWRVYHGHRRDCLCYSIYRKSVKH